MHGAAPGDDDTFVDWFGHSIALVLAVVAVVVALKLLSFLWFRIRQRGRRPLVVQLTGPARGRKTGTAADAPDGASSLNERLLAYLAADGQDGDVVAPGAGAPAAPQVPAEALSNSESWVLAAFSLALAREPAYRVDVTWHLDSRVADAGHAATVRISRTPGDAIVASESFREPTEDGLISAIGCFCITFMRSRRRALSGTPRWERWTHGTDGYRAYRDALDRQRQADQRNRRPAYKEALRLFEQAARQEPANLTVRLHWAALLELLQRHDEAVGVYEKCQNLWPEHVETTYRLVNAYTNMPGPFPDPDKLHVLLDQAANRLRTRMLLRLWLRNLRPLHANPGERRYWRSWLRPARPGQVSRRHGYRNALAVTHILLDLDSLLPSPHKVSARRRGPRGASRKDQVNELFERLAAEILPRSRTRAVIRLFHPGQRGGTHRAHREPQDPARIPFTPPKPGVGWLAHYNAACFFSLASTLDAADIPDDFAPADWRVDCVKAAVWQLGSLVRNPGNELDPDWFRTDPDLEPLRASPTSRAWSTFVGLSPRSLPDRLAARIRDELPRR